MCFPRLPETLQLRPYQEQAIASWFANRGRGTLKMATGSGKTIAALAIAAAMYGKIGLQSLIVVCPYRHLVTQWQKQCQQFHLEPVLAFENVRHWQSQLATQLYNVRNGNLGFLSVITTNSSLISDGFQSQLKYFPDKTLIVGDEAHNLGTPKLEASLPRHIGLRLALSATPERHFDDAGTEAIFDYFGAVLQPELTLADAIAIGALVRYQYYPVLVHLTDAESRLYSRLTQRIGWALAKEKRPDDRDDLAALLMQRARIIGAATNKLNALRAIMKHRLHTTHTLFYCGDGTMEDDVSGDSYRQLEKVTQILGSELGYRVNNYTAKTPLDEREQLRQQFDRGELQGLVSIRCLDEGVDIPTIQTAVILASSSNPRQFVQRRGRILRRAPDKDRATLFDTIVVPPEGDRETWEVERNLLRKELKRFVEFADLADNAGQARTQLLNLQQEYGLLDL